MMKVQIFSGVKDSKLTTNRESFIKALKNHEGHEILITVERKFKKHSDEQRGYYFGVVVALIRESIFKEWGDKLSSTEVHELLKQNCNWKEKTNKSTGEVIKIPGSIKLHSTKEQEDYHEECRRWALEWFNVIIPLPNEEIEFNS